MEIDGSDAIQLTKDAIMNRDPAITPDGRTVLYEGVDADGNPSIWKVSMDGGESTQLTDFASSRPTVSPDGKLFACALPDPGFNKPEKVAVMSITGGQSLRTLELPPLVKSRTIRWSPDGKSLIYIHTQNRVSNLWAQPIDGGPATQLTNFESDEIRWFDVSPDGRFALSRGNERSDVVLISSFR
jgi:Tol biopolymer transport system component